MNWTTVVSARELAGALERSDLRLLDARAVLSEPAAGIRGYAEAHLPGAQFADLNQDLSDLNRAGCGRHPLPEAEVFARKLGAWGIAPQHQVVVYDAGDGSMAAARAWWLLKLLGHARVAVLDGGLAAWRAAGLPETAETPVPEDMGAYPGSFEASRIVGTDEVQARLTESPGWLFDARAPERYSGENEHIDPVAGHVPGAINLPYARNLRDGRLLPVEELRASLSAALAGGDPDRAVLMCGSGVTACHLLLAFEHAGLSGPRVYAGSWSEWIGDPQRPVARGN
ncbi:sulfurtransferase [Pseudoxanthomonas kalamensis DSM 18571]|uniref:sulfurtransferase n=1 Tax=Pseudoxanthomonas kalamensis TaxID=289483 RepID=UPI0013911347|nr:sulfurtransferase [Pseudoxanthomonas kalamensis]KAF1710485.1 sulfurtransferase [Pseudoxanthomonas kalamensis DSM 18571]